MSVNSLLEVLFIRKAMPAVDFRAALEILVSPDIEGPENERAEFFREREISLIEGGFCRRSEGGRKIEAECPVLTVLPHSPSRAMLFGTSPKQLAQRCSEEVERNGLRISLEELSLADNWPTRYIFAGAPESLAVIAQRVGIRFFATPLAFVLADGAISLETEVQGATFNHALPPIDAEWFNPRTLKFDGNQPQTFGDFSLCRYQNHGRKFATFRVRADNGGLESVETRNPAGVKWLQISRLEERFLWVDNNGSVAVPKYCPLPRDFARALALCSGLPPRLGVSVSGVDLEVTIYEKVHPIILNLICRKFGCDVTRVPLLI
jgi:hypothetical protein